MGKRRRKTIDGPLLFEDMRTTKQVFRDIRNYLAGQFVGATRDDVLLSELLKCLFCKLYVETSKSKVDIGKLDAVEAAQAYRATFAKVRADFSEIYAENEEILLDPSSLQQVMKSLHFSLIDGRNDPIGDAYEVFTGSESRSRSGQFFTPRNATDMLVAMIDPKLGETVVDPACGAGGFLASVSRYFHSNGASHQDTAKACGNLFGIEKDEYLVGLAKIHVSLLSAGHPTIVCADSLSQVTQQEEPLEEAMSVEGYDVLLTNPPFGAKIVSANAKVLGTFDLGKKWEFDKADECWFPTNEIRPQVPPQVLFIERCLSLVRDGGRLGMVVPESLLSNKAYRHVVQYIRTNSEIKAVVGMPDSLFKTSGKGGTHTKTCCLVLEKRKPSGRKKVFMAEAKWCGHDSRAREIPHDDLPEIGDNFQKFMNRKKFSPSSNGFTIDAKEMNDNILCPRYFDPEIAAELEKLSKTHDLLRFGDLVDAGHLSVKKGDEVGKLAYSTGDVPFVRTSDIGSWEIKFDPKHCIAEDIYDRLKNKQDVQANDILMVKDGTYLIGTCAIVTRYDEKIVYQSHLYKIRVKENGHGITPCLLLAMLGSPVVHRQIKAKQFTQDIIDSLGDRINELILPVPKSEKKRKAIDKMVSQAVEDRIEARELARRARLEVLT